MTTRPREQVTERATQTYFGSARTSDGAIRLRSVTRWGYAPQFPFGTLPSARHCPEAVMTVPSVPSLVRTAGRWHSVAVALFVGVFFVPVSLVLLQSATTVVSLSSQAGAGGGGRPTWAAAVWAFAALSAGVATLGLSAAIYRDAVALAGSDWAPDPRRYALPALLYPLSLAVGGWYLYRRYRTVGIGGFPLDEPLDEDTLAESRWWYHVAAGPFLLFAGVWVFLLPSDLGSTVSGPLFVRLAALAVLSGTGIAVFTVGLAADIAHVRHSAVPWTPGRQRYTLVPLLVPLFVPFVAAVYLLNRHRHVGVP